jgi:hypothetical protein
MPEKTLDELILESARLTVQLRKRFRAQRDDGTSENPRYTYVLLLQDECVYIGTTTNIFIRLMDHLHETTMTSNWVREHGPVIRVLEIIRNSTIEDETYKTLEYMTMFGYESVRGASWCKLELRHPPAAFHTFRRDRSDFEYVYRKEIDEIVQTARDLYETMNS